MRGSEKRLNLKCGVLWVSRRERSSLVHTFLSQHDEAWRAQRAAVTHAHPPHAMKTTVTILACLRDQKQNGKCYPDDKKHDVIRTTNQMRKLKTNIASALAEQETFSCSGRARCRKFSKETTTMAKRTPTVNHIVLSFWALIESKVCGSNMLLYKEGNTELWDLTDTDRCSLGD